MRKAYAQAIENLLAAAALLGACVQTLRHHLILAELKPHRESLDKYNKSFKRAFSSFIKKYRSFFRGRAQREDAFDLLVVAAGKFDELKEEVVSCFEEGEFYPLEFTQAQVEEAHAAFKRAIEAPEVLKVERQAAKARANAAPDMVRFAEAVQSMEKAFKDIELLLSSDV